jgi:hypothetical protein
MKALRRSTAMSIRQQLRCALLLVVLCALGVQQWAAQTHWHAPAADVSSALHPFPADDPAERLPGHDCLLCLFASHAGAAAPPVVWAGLPAAELLSATRLAAGITAEFPAPPAWAWQSRGPPAV